MYTMCLIDLFIFTAVAGGFFAALRIVRAADDDNDQE